MGNQVYEKSLFVISTAPVATTQVANQYKCVTVAGVLTGGTTGTGGLGILQNKPIAGEAAEVAVGGVSKAIAGATIVAGDLLTNEATTGHVIPATSTDRLLGQALTAGADTELISMLVVPSNAINAAA